VEFVKKLYTFLSVASLTNFCIKIYHIIISFHAAVDDAAAAVSLSRVWRAAAEKSKGHLEYVTVE
jgi:hypothetical protein